MNKSFSLTYNMQNFRCVWWWHHLKEQATILLPC